MLQKHEASRNVSDLKRLENLVSTSSDQPADLLAGPLWHRVGTKNLSALPATSRPSLPTCQQGVLSLLSMSLR